jgi:hypothetical protein
MNQPVTVGGISTPALVTAAGERAGVRFLEFFAGSVALRKLGRGLAEQIGILILKDRRIARQLNDAVHRHSSSALSLSSA